MTTQPQDPKRRALGRGLEALLPQRPASPPPPAPVSLSASAEQGGQPLEIPLDQIERNPFQTRSRFDPEKLTELAQSIAATGVVQPIIVRPLPPASDGTPRYQLISGERRLLASRQSGKATVPAILRTVSDEQAMEMTIVENLQRADLNPMEQARAYQRLADDFRMTQDQMAFRTGKERASVANFLRLLRLPLSVQDQVESGVISFGHARSLLALSQPEQIVAAAQKVVALSLSVRQTETYIQSLINPEGRPPRPARLLATQDPNVHEAQERLQRALGLRVRIEDKQGRGRVIIDYANVDDFDLLLAALDAQAAE